MESLWGLLEAVGLVEEADDAGPAEVGDGGEEPPPSSTSPFDLTLRPVMMEKLPADKFGFGLIGPEEEDGDNHDGSTADGFVVYITRVDKDSVAEQAKLKLGDRIISINGTSTRGFGLVETLQLISASDRLEFVVAFDPAGFEQMQDELATQIGGGAGASPRHLDMRRIQLKKGASGFGLALLGGAGGDVEERVFVRSVVEGSVAAGTKLRPGDRIVSINGSRGLGMTAVLGILTSTDTVTLEVYGDADRMSQMIELYAEGNPSDDEIEADYDATTAIACTVTKVNGSFGIALLGTGGVGGDDDGGEAEQDEEPVLFIKDITPRSAAALAGLVAGHQVIAVNGKVGLDLGTVHRILQENDSVDFQTMPNPEGFGAFAEQHEEDGGATFELAPPGAEAAEAAAPQQPVEVECQAVKREIKVAPVTQNPDDMTPAEVAAWMSTIKLAPHLAHKYAAGILENAIDGGAMSSCVSPEDLEVIVPDRLVRRNVFKAWADRKTMFEQYAIDTV